MNASHKNLEQKVLFNNALNTLYLRLYGKGPLSKRGNLYCHMDYSFQLVVRVLLYALSHLQDSTYHGLCYTSCGALAGTRNRSMMKDRSDNQYHHEQMLLLQIYILLLTKTTASMIMQHPYYSVPFLKTTD